MAKIKTLGDAVVVVSTLKFEDIKGFIADQLGSTITQLEKLEETVPTILAEVKAEREAIVSSIEIAQSWS